MKRRTPWGLARLLLILVLAVVMVSVMGTVAFAEDLDSSAEKECYLVGDMNADGKFSTDDAIYTLYYTFYPDDYPLKQNGDFTGDDKVKTADAIELLYATFYGDWPEYEKFGTAAHDYYDPAWSWHEGDLLWTTASMHCACGFGSHGLEVEEPGMTLGKTVAATCTKAGYQEYIATVTVHGKTYTATYTKTFAPTGHEAVSAGFDEEQHYELCECGEKINASSHSWEADGEASQATCQVASVQNYKCSCGATKSEQLGFAEHAFVYVKDVLLEGETCRYAKLYDCENCDETKLTDEYDNHNHVATVTKEATCQEDGEKAYKCTRCGAVDRTEAIENTGDEHIWDNGEELDGVIVYTCTICDQTKTAVTTKEDGTVSKDVLQSADQLQVGDTTLEMEEAVKEGLDADKEIQITVETMDVAEAEEKLSATLTEEQKEQIGDNLIYDFNMMYEGGQKVEFAGLITVTLPYTLAEGEDADAITVWFIDDDGTLEEKAATYNNGYVTFQTEHFSYYTVTRLTPAERCARYDHIWTSVSKAATCTDDGYTKEVCQRCAAERKLVETTKLGHDYQTTVTAPTCTKFGTTVETCSNCGHTKSTVTPALGHKMALSNTVKATCDAAGEEIYACTNEDCDHTIKKVLPQLTHKYEKDEDKTVKATCTTGGYDVHVCEYCGDEIKKNETTPLGHKYSDPVWNWAEDDESAKLTLTCENGCGTPKELEANITVKKATCTGDGLLIASVYYNNKSYTDEKTGASATGHIPGDKWITTETQHYYQCQGCKEKLEIATHDFGEGVITKEPTCTKAGVITYTCSVCGYTKDEVAEPSGKHSYDDGIVTREPTCAKAGVITYTCSACGNTKEETIPATGEHTYVDGSCSVCGKQQTACNHYRMDRRQLLDTSAFDICPGFELYEISCECGERRMLEVDGITCELEEISAEETEFGITYVEECVNCGLHAESGQKVEFNADPCRAELVYWGELSIGGKRIDEFSQVVDGADHYAHNEVEKVEITGQGTCDMTFVTMRCDCGERVETEVRTSCDWMYNGDNREICRICGCSYTWEASDNVWDGCQVSYNWTYTYYNKAGEEIYSYTDTHTEYSHDFRVTNYEMYGDNCEDGVWVEYLCGECGETTDYYYEGGHPTVVREDTDLSDANICAVYHIQESCACGFRKYAELIYDEDYCQWAQIRDPNEAPATGDSYTEYYECSVCRAQQTVEIIHAEKDENCISSYSEIRTYKDADGNVLVVGETLEKNEAHDYRYDFELLGESCEDGVIITEYCVDCDWSNSWQIAHHEVQETHYELRELGLCGGYIRVCSCPCGEESWAEIEPWGCNWQGTGGENWANQKCMNCGATWDFAYEETPIDGCHSQTHYVHTFGLADGTEVLHLDYVEKQTNHRWITEFEGTCDDDYFYAHKTCLTCGETELNRDWGHEWYPVSRELVSEGELCGSAELVTYACPCGEMSRTEVYWIGGECDFRHTGYGEEDDSYIYTCMTCGAIRYERNYHEQVPGGTECQRQHRWEYTYMKDGRELFVESGVGTYSEHTWHTETELLGESCEDGVIVRQTCSKCGYQDGEYTTYYHEVVEEHYDLAELGFCGGWVHTYSCACGEHAGTNVEPDGCNWRGMGDPGWFYRECADCGGVWEQWWEEIYIDDCHSQSHNIHSFRVGGEEVLHLEWTSNYEHHEWETRLTLMVEGGTCEDGVIVERYCPKCGESESYETYDHDWFELAYYDFSEYGFCDGYLRVVGCACGQEKDVEYGSNCTWYGMGGFGGGGNSITLPCEKCGMQFTMSWTNKISIGGCDYRRDYTYTFENEDVNITETDKRYYADHRNYYILETTHSDSCVDGYYVYEYCADCGNHLGEWGGMGDHETFIVERVPVAVDAKVCGRVDMLTYSCACGEITYTGYEFVDCEFGEYYHEEMGEWIIACKGCGTELYETYEETPIEGETCKEVETTTVMYLQNGEAFLTYSFDQITEAHDTLASYTLVNPNGTCDSGYTITWICWKCGEVTGNSGVNYGCRTMLVARELLAEKGVLCGDFYLDTYSCACGAYGSTQTHWENGGCSFQEIWDEEQDRWINVCDTCGVERVYQNSRTPVEGESCKYLYHENYTYFRDGVELFSYTRSYESTSHMDVAQLTLVNPEGTCDDGYTVTWVCDECGMFLREDSEVYYGCCSYTVEKKPLAYNNMLCGDLYRYTNRCACGKLSGSHLNWWYGSCDFEHTGYNEEEQCNVYTCSKCGAYRKEYSSTQETGIPCQNIYYWEDTYYNAAGEYLFSDSGSNVSHNPTWIVSYEMLGETCDEGYYRTLTCYHCGEVIKETDIRYGCSNERVAITQIINEAWSCGPIYLYEYSCGCGRYSGWNMDHRCSFYWLKDDEETGERFYQCSDCGLIYSSLEEYEREPFSCLRTENVVYRYYIQDGGKLFELTSFYRTFQRRAHQEVYDYTLAEGATSCEDGYYLGAHCIYCDYSWFDSDIRYDHSSRAVTYYNLEDYGKCGGAVQERACACGQNHYWDYWAYEGCSFEHTGNYNEYGIYERYCEACNTYVYMDTRGENAIEECRATTTLYAQLVRDGVVLLDLVESWTSPNHTMLVVGYEGNCEDGGIAYEQCYYCGEQSEYTWDGGHYDMRVDFLDMKNAGGCGGYIYNYVCTCGYYSNLWFEDVSCNWNYGKWEGQEIDGVWHYTRDRICDNCGLWVRESYYETESDEPCRMKRIRTYEIWMAESLVKTFEAVERYEAHNYQVTDRQLLGETCEDGVVVTYTCVCGDSYNGNYYYHEKHEQEDQSIDLTQFGSVCGCELQYLTCVCGQYQSYALEGECDIDTSDTPVWLEDALNEGQDTSEGWVTCYSYANTLTCAVTNPQCGLKIRMAGVWLPGENCTAVYYEIWQLGYRETYDETTGQTTCSWQQEIMIPTGEVRTHHNYEYTASNTLENGNGLVTNSYICSHCGSSYVEVREFVDYNCVRYEDTAINTLNNGENQKRVYLREYTWTEFGYEYNSLNRSSVIYADGTEWWSQTERYYVEDGGCSFVVRSTDSNGNVEEYEYEHYNTYVNWDYEKYPTCTQFGVEIRRECCSVCGEEVSVEYYDVEPHDHEWYCDYSEQCYYCNECGLENANGASGTIAIEDLTYQYGNDTNYVVGYWNKGDEDFLVYASVILDEIDEDDNELILSGIDFIYLSAEADGITALSASQTDIQDAAKAAMAEVGYTGSYAIRITFVPADNDGTLDYAITFDSQTA